MAKSNRDTLVEYKTSIKNSSGGTDWKKACTKIIDKLIELDAESFLAVEACEKLCHTAENARKAIRTSEQLRDSLKDFSEKNTPQVIVISQFDEFERKSKDFLNSVGLMVNTYNTGLANQKSISPHQSKLRKVLPKYAKAMQEINAITKTMKKHVTGCVENDKIEIYTIESKKDKSVELSNGEEYVLQNDSLKKTPLDKYGEEALLFYYLNLFAEAYAATIKKYAIADDFIDLATNFENKYKNRVEPVKTDKEFYASEYTKAKALNAEFKARFFGQTVGAGQQAVNAASPAPMQRPGMIAGQ